MRRVPGDATAAISGRATSPDVEIPGALIAAWRQKRYLERIVALLEHISIISTVLGHHDRTIRTIMMIHQNRHQAAAQLLANIVFYNVPKPVPLLSLDGLFCLLSRLLNRIGFITSVILL